MAQIAYKLNYNLNTYWYLINNFKELSITENDFFLLFWPTLIFKLKKNIFLLQQMI